MDVREILSRLIWASEAHCGTLAQRIVESAGDDPEARAAYAMKMAEIEAAIDAADAWLLQNWQG